MKGLGMIAISVAAFALSSSCAETHQEKVFPPEWANDGKEYAISENEDLRKIGSHETRVFLDWQATRSGKEDEFIVMSVVVDASGDIVDAIFAGCAMLNSDDIQALSGLTHLRRLIALKLDQCTANDIRKIARFRSLQSVLIVTYPPDYDRAKVAKMMGQVNMRLCSEISGQLPGNPHV